MLLEAFQMSVPACLTHPQFPILRAQMAGRLIAVQVAKQMKVRYLITLSPSGYETSVVSVLCGAMVSGFSTVLCTSPSKSHHHMIFADHLLERRMCVRFIVMLTQQELDLLLVGDPVRSLCFRTCCHRPPGPDPS